MNRQPGKKVILVVEDEEPIARMIEQMLLLEGEYDVVHAAEGRAALEVLRNTNVDLILTDLTMPGLGGIALYDRLHADPALGTWPMLFMSAHSGYDTGYLALAGRGLGDHLIRKPFTIDTLLDQVSRVLNLAPVQE